MTNFAPLKNTNFIRALQKQPVDRTPSWALSS